MEHADRRGLVQRFLDDLRSQREVDLRDALAELIHLVFELDDSLKALEERLAGLEERAEPGD